MSDINSFINKHGVGISGTRSTALERFISALDDQIEKTKDANWVYNKTSWIRKNRLGRWTVQIRIKNKVEPITRGVEAIECATLGHAVKCLEDIKKEILLGDKGSFVHVYAKLRSMDIRPSDDQT